MGTKTDLVVEVKSPADKLWAALRDSTELFPKIFPQQYQSIETVEGDGKSAGTVRLLKYTEGVPMLTFAKEKLELADDENKVVSYSVVDGELVNFYKNFRITLKVSPGKEGAVVNWSMEFDKANEQVPDPDVIKETATKTFHDLDDYLLKNAAEAAPAAPAHATSAFRRSRVMSGCVLVCDRYLVRVNKKLALFVPGTRGHHKKNNALRSARRALAPTGTRKANSAAGTTTPRRTDRENQAPATGPGMHTRRWPGRGMRRSGPTFATPPDTSFDNFLLTKQSIEVDHANVDPCRQYFGPVKVHCFSFLNGDPFDGQHQRRTNVYPFGEIGYSGSAGTRLVTQPAG
ncbi:hypothetical protein HU200_032175 [Digitaria exilis]|uniref:Bet v I/Major latex protein domain-containing protein n=1 Tax=Digitaria exilis TaxID=1010633 RepID=A0A835BKF8_9POAL|nr:hypothetical protein HU200_032175 [Digitaria exilis]